MSFVGLKRTVVGEIMDSPTLDRTEHLHALAGLRRLNLASNTVSSMAKPLLAWARQASRKKNDMLDIACGSGDVPLGIATALQNAGISLSLTLSDRSQTALDQAQQLATHANVQIHTLQTNAVVNLPQNAFDIVTNSLFLHHLERPDLLRLLANMRRALRPGGMLLISDLRRSRTGLLLANIACRLLTRSKVVHFDGPASVRAAWTKTELAPMLHEAGMPDARIQNAWPQRLLISWCRPVDTQHPEPAPALATAGA
ncbi:MAG: methyltransferase domain-containing protein [Phycisphaerae bacterium]